MLAPIFCACTPLAGQGSVPAPIMCVPARDWLGKQVCLRPLFVCLRATGCASVCVCAQYRFESMGLPLVDIDMLSVLIDSGHAAVNSSGHLRTSNANTRILFSSLSISTRISKIGEVLLSSLSITTRIHKIGEVLLCDVLSNTSNNQLRRSSLFWLEPRWPTMLLLG